MFVMTMSYLILLPVIRLLKNRVLEVKAKFRYITEVRKDNIPYCKELMKVGQVRHLDGIRSNFVVTDTEYTSSAIMKQANMHIQK